jgi:hypothetical protein
MGPDPFTAADRATARVRLTAMRQVENLNTQTREEPVLCAT